jgi:hypothetical protein
MSYWVNRCRQEHCGYLPLIEELLLIIFIKISYLYNVFKFVAVKVESEHTDSVFSSRLCISESVLLLRSELTAVTSS